MVTSSYWENTDLSAFSSEGWMMRGYTSRSLLAMVL